LKILKKRADMKKVVMILEHDLIHPYVDSRPYKEAQSLIKNGYNVTFITWNLYRNNPYPDIEFFNHIKIIRKQILIRRSIIILQYFFIFIITIKEIKNLNIDFIHCHDTYPLLTSSISKLLYKKKLIYDAHELSSFLQEHILLKIFYRISERITYSYWDVLITANSERAAVMLAKYNLQKTKIMYLNNFPCNAGKEIHHFDKPDNVINILYQGMISKEREIDKIIEFSKDLNLNYHFYIVGKYWPSKDYYTNLVKKHNLVNKVTLLDPLKNHDLQDLMKNCHIGLIPLNKRYLNNYLCEPNKLYEYLFMNMRVIMPNCFHLNKINKILKENFVYFYNDITEIFSIIINNFEEIKDNKHLNMNNVYENFSYETIERTFLAEYNEI